MIRFGNLSIRCKRLTLRRTLVSVVEKWPIELFVDHCPSLRATISVCGGAEAQEILQCVQDHFQLEA